MNGQICAGSFFIAAATASFFLRLWLPMSLCATLAALFFLAAYARKL